jgi:hypothetical protein
MFTRTCHNPDRRFDRASAHGPVLAHFVELLDRSLPNRSFLSFLNRRVLSIVSLGEISSFAFSLTKRSLLPLKNLA